MNINDIPTSDTKGAKVQSSAMEVVKLRKKANDDVLPSPIVKKHINNRSDVQGWMQLAFHGTFALGAMYVVQQARASESIVALILSELVLGFIASFYFMGFHELIHGTAFDTTFWNQAFAHVFGFFIFRGAKWYYYFHWNHHRFTNDPSLDPELSGVTVDRADPLEIGGWAGMKAYTTFLSGFPFGFERIPGIFRYALGTAEDEIWVNSNDKKKAVQIEYACFATGYLALLVASLLRPATIGAPLWYYWIVPHMLGAGHLRYYQTAEHRSCHQAPYTEGTAWANSRTSSTNWLYARLAWNMPYHSEHHAWPNIPFHQLPAVSKAIEERGTRPRSGCNPTGERGYLHMHINIFNKVLAGLQSKKGG